MLSHLWSARLDIRELYTPLDRCVGVWLGKVDRGVVEELRRGRFDQAPVFGGPTGLIGVVYTEELERLLEAAEALHEGHDAISRATIPAEASLDTLLTARAETRGRLVCGDRPEGLITISDLNRYPFRVALGLSPAGGLLLPGSLSVGARTLHHRSLTWEAVCELPHPASREIRDYLKWKLQHSKPIP